MEIEDELRQAVEADKRTRNDIAKAAGIHYVSLSRFMTGNRELSLTLAKKLAGALGKVLKLGRSK